MRLFYLIPILILASNGFCLGFTKDTVFAMQSKESIVLKDHVNDTVFLVHNEVTSDSFDGMFIKQIQTEFPFEVGFFIHRLFPPKENYSSIYIYSPDSQFDQEERFRVYGLRRLKYENKVGILKSGDSLMITNFAIAPTFHPVTGGGAVNANYLYEDVPDTLHLRMYVSMEGVVLDSLEMLFNSQMLLSKQPSGILNSFKESSAKSNGGNKSNLFGRLNFEVFGKNLGKYLPDGRLLQ